MIVATSLSGIGIDDLRAGDLWEWGNGRYKATRSIIDNLAANENVEKIQIYGSFDREITLPPRMELCDIGDLRSTAMRDDFVWLEPGRHHRWHVSQLRAKEGLRFPIVSMAHSVAYSDQPPNVFADLSTPTQCGDVIVAPSAATVDVLKKQYSTAASHMIVPPSSPAIEKLPYGVDSPGPLDALESRRKLCLSENGAILLAINRFDASDKADWVGYIEVLRRLVEHENVYLILAGRAHGDRVVENIRVLADLYGVGESVIFRPNVTDEDKQLLYSAADVVISLATTPSESFGLVLVEAMLSKRAVVCSRWSGYSEVVSDGSTGLLVDCKWASDRDRPFEAELSFFGQAGDDNAGFAEIDRAMAADEVLRLLRNRNVRTSMGERGFDRARRLYTMEHFGNRVVSRLSHSLQQSLSCDQAVPITPINGRNRTGPPDTWLSLFERYASVK